MSRFRILLAFAFWAALILLGMPATSYAAKRGYVNSGQEQQQNKFTGVMTQVSNGVVTAGVWTLKAPYLVGKYFVTEIFRPFVPVRDKLIDWFGVEVEG